MNIRPFFEKYTAVTGLVQKEFERNLDKYGDKIKCCKGCSQCCHQIFNITLIDEFMIKKVVTELPEDKQSILKSKAKDYLEKFRANESDTSGYSKRPGLPCPALGESGECTIYDGRPIICRRFGPPIYDYKNPANLYACELNFKTGEEIVDDELIPEQTRIGKMWDSFKTEFNLQFDKNTKTSTTIAEAILNS